MVMRFADIAIAWQYVRLCQALGFMPTQGRDGRYYTVRTYHPNRASRRFLTAKWADASCVVYGDGDERQLKFKL
jgi:hypothetical protein